MMQLITLRNTHGLTAVITNYGGRVVSLFAPDRTGRFEDLVLGYDKPEDYLHSNEKYYGALIGRYGNRIGKARFPIGNQMYFLEKNNGENSLHGGNGGFHNVCWTTRQINDGTLELTYVSNDLEEGFPGTLAVRVVYCLTGNNDLKIEYFASTDKPTVINLTHHSFFNLTGDPSQTINHHILQIPASFYTLVDEGLIPTGEIASVKDTPFDFRMPTPIGERLGEDHAQLKFGRGYDHNWVLDGAENSSGLRMAAKVTEPVSGRMMTVYTNEPGIQFYGGNFLNGEDTGKGGIAYRHRTAFCLETQHFPDSPNKDHFPPVLLKPGEEYYSVCLYHFDCE